MRQVDFSARRGVVVGSTALLILIAFFYLRGDLGNFSLEFLSNPAPTVVSQLDCDTTIIDARVLASQRRISEPMRVVIYFNEKPTFDAREYLLSHAVRIDLATWTGEYLEADALTGQLCFLATVPGVTRVSAVE